MARACYSTAFVMSIAIADSKFVVTVGGIVA
jgi:hypothetical protein